MFDKNMMGSWRTFIHLKGIERLGSKTSNVVEPMKLEHFQGYNQRRWVRSLSDPK
jgi:hypothetical protein